MNSETTVLGNRERLREILNSAPRERLGNFPTPLQYAQNLSERLEGPDIYFKRDDLTGFAGGGNKIRSVEFLLGEARENDADVIIPQGGPQSNCIRAVTLAAKKMGFEVIPVIYGNHPDEIRGNFTLIRAGADRIVFTNDSERSSVEPRAEELSQHVRDSGRTPYVIPRGGATPTGALGYMNFARELVRQQEDRNLDINALVMPSGSCLSQAGLIVGAKLSGLDCSVDGILVSREESSSRDQITRIVHETKNRFGLAFDFDPASISVTDRFLGKGFSVTTPAAGKAFRTVIETEGILLDPVYTSKAMAGLMDRVESRHYTQNDSVVFLHTGGISLLYSFVHGLGRDSVEPTKVY